MQHLGVNFGVFGGLILVSLSVFVVFAKEIWAYF